VKLSNILNEINSGANKKVMFQPQQMARTKELLRKIIVKEKNPNSKKRFENLLGLISGKYPNAKVMLSAVKGMKKIMKEFSTLNEATQPKKTRIIRKLVATTLLALTFATSVLSCQFFLGDLNPTPENIYKHYESFIENPAGNDIVYIKVSEQEVDNLNNILDEYLNNMDNADQMKGAKLRSYEADPNSLESGYYNPVDTYININKNNTKDPDYRHEDMAHEDTHRRQFFLHAADAFLGSVFGQNTPTGYPLEPIEINAYFNQAVYAINKKLEKGQTIDSISYWMNAPQQNIVAALLVYDKLRGTLASPKGISLNNPTQMMNKDIDNFFTVMKNTNPQGAYETFIQIKNDKAKIHDYFIDLSNGKSMAQSKMIYGKKK
jgi:hypothetical protein